MFLWASAFVAIRSAGAHYSPGALALGRLFSGAVVLVAFLLVRREGLPPRAAWPGIAASGVLWFGVYMVALNWGEQEVDAGTAAMVVNVGPVLIALLGGWLLKEGFRPRVLAGIAVSFSGAVVVGFSMSGGGHASVLGVLLCVVAAATYAVGVACAEAGAAPRLCLTGDHVRLSGRDGGVRAVRRAARVAARHRARVRDAERGLSPGSSRPGWRSRRGRTRWPSDVGGADGRDHVRGAGVGRR